MTDRSSTEDRLDGTLDTGNGTLKQTWGNATGDDQIKAEGVLDESKGTVKQSLGNLKDAAADLKDDAERTTR